MYVLPRRPNRHFHAIEHDREEAVHETAGRPKPSCEKAKNADEDPFGHCTVLGHILDVNG